MGGFYFTTWKEVILWTLIASRLVLNRSGRKCNLLFWKAQRVYRSPAHIPRLEEIQMPPSANKAGGIFLTAIILLEVRYGLFK
jgi:hypothetical protein